MNNTLSYEGIQGELISQLNKRHSENYYQELREILNNIISMIKESQTVNAGDDESISISSVSICKKMEDDSEILLRFVDYYLSGNISSCYNAFQRWWRGKRIDYYDEKYKTSIFYRMREKKNRDDNFSYKDLLHIPFDLRGIITNQRYSICGYPCLYVSTSLYQTWEELRRPYLQNLYAVAIRFTENLSLFDMRLKRDIMSEKQLRCYLQRLLLIIACSVKVKNDNDPFKPEYIIPQTLLHTIIRNKIDGILYSSMRKDFSFYNDEQWDFSKNENVVIPVKSNLDKGHCNQLQRIMEVSNSLNLEQEMIKGNIMAGKAIKYENTLLGQLESELKTVPSHFLIASDGIKDKIGLGLNNRSKLKIEHLLK